MADEKNHSTIHMPSDFAHYGNAINFTCDPPEEAHKTGKRTRHVHKSRPAGSFEYDVALIEQGGKFFAV
jgi:hypothetical protein